MDVYVTLNGKVVGGGVVTESDFASFAMTNGKTLQETLTNAKERGMSVGIVIPMPQTEEDEPTK